MSQEITILVPNIGDFDSVEITEVLVSKGDQVKPEDSLITVETDKASMEIPCADSGVVTEVLVNVGDMISEGSAIFKVLATAESAVASTEDSPAIEASTTSEQSQTADSAPESAHKPQPATFSGDADKHAHLVVLGSGPRGYTAALRAADQGVNLIMSERYESIGSNS